MALYFPLSRPFKKDRNSFKLAFLEGKRGLKKAFKQDHLKPALPVVRRARSTVICLIGEGGGQNTCSASLCPISLRPFLRFLSFSKWKRWGQYREFIGIISYWFHFKAVFKAICAPKKQIPY